jgi:hypothetical protein
MNFEDFGNLFLKEEDEDMKKFTMMMNNVHINLDLLNFNKKNILKNKISAFFK